MNNNDPITSNNSNTTNRVLQIIYQFEILTWYEEVIVIVQIIVVTEIDNVPMCYNNPTTIIINNNNYYWPFFFSLLLLPLQQHIIIIYSYYYLNYGDLLFMGRVEIAGERSWRTFTTTFGTTALVPNWTSARLCSSKFMHWA